MVALALRDADSVCGAKRSAGTETAAAMVHR
jgi:hypothetical protein